MRRWVIIVALVLLLLTVVAATCGSAQMVRRRDTSTLVGMLIDSAPASVVRQVFTDALPNEGAVCLYGRIHDTLVVTTPIPQTIAHVGIAEPATAIVATDSTLEFNRADSTRVDGCRKAKNLIGIGHSHPKSFGRCTHSDVDAIFLFRRVDLYFSFVLCPGGAFEVLWQDGRRLP